MSGPGSRITRPSTNNKKAFAATVDLRRCESASTEGAVTSPRARVRTVSRTGAPSGRVPTSTGTSATSGWKPRIVRQPDDAPPATMKAQAAAARTRCRQTFDTEVEASRRKDDWGAPNFYPRRGDHSSSPNRRHPVYEPCRRISKAAATRLGDARGTRHDITDLKARTFTSLQKKDLRLARGDRKNSRRGRALNFAGVPPAALGVPTTLSPTPSYEVIPFEPESVGSMDDPNTIMMYGRIPLERDQLVHFLDLRSCATKNSRSPLSYVAPNVAFFAGSPPRWRRRAARYLPITCRNAGRLASLLASTSR